MHLIRRLLGPPPAAQPEHDGPPAGVPQGAHATHLAMASALTFGLAARDARLGFVEHCARVAELAGRVAAELDVPAGDRDLLDAAARLHEIGILSVPAGILESPRRLVPEDRALIREHASIGAEIVRATHPERTARLIEHQYTDFAQLRQVFADDLDLLLAGILRAADVFDAVTHPRPYQDRLRDTHRERIFVQGSGIRFHPQAVEVLLHVEA
ncbi:MAG TPA: HD domain-containing phosphohydrolase [Longimicrobium sp.]|nr:HD domain-containing phosphohydrolase [Longimicrobium sp.]